MSTDAAADYPLLLDSDLLAAIDRAAAPLQSGDRAAFVEAVYAHLDGQMVGPGSLFRVLAECQREFLRARPIVRAGRPPRAPYHMTKAR